MTLFTESKMRARAQAESAHGRMIKKASDYLRESASSFSESKPYDIFLSHSIKDAELVQGVCLTLTDLGYSVYVDWIEDPQLDRSNVSKETAEQLRKRMNSCKSLFYLTTDNAVNSKWMPWECGYFDAKKTKVAIIPVKASSLDNDFKGTEYLGLYPYVVELPDTSQKKTLWVLKNAETYTSYNVWVITPNEKIEWKQMK